MKTGPKKLKPCPFCGEDEVIVYKWGMSSYWTVSCENEECPMNSALENRFESKDDAISFWNTRSN